MIFCLLFAFNICKAFFLIEAIMGGGENLYGISWWTIHEKRLQMHGTHVDPFSFSALAESSSSVQGKVAGQKANRSFEHNKHKTHAYVAYACFPAAGTRQLSGKRMKRLSHIEAWHLCWRR